MSFAIEVDTAVTVGAPLVLLEALYGNPLWVSNGVLVFAPDTPNTMTAPPSLARLALNVTVIEVTVEVVTTS
jgi:hypothetical protein